MGYSPTKKLSLWALLALVIGSMLDSGIFSLPATFAKATGGLGAIIAWCIAGCGMLMLVFVFQGLSHRKPELDGGVFTYAKAEVYGIRKGNQGIRGVETQISNLDYQ